MLSKEVPNIGTSIFQYDITEGMTDGCTGEQSTDPKGNVTLKVNDKAGRLLTVNADNKTTTYSYFANGSRQSVVYPDGSREDYTYFEDGLNKTLVNKKADATEIDSYSYTYDAAHNQTSKTDKKGVTSYTYDSLNRLQTVIEPTGKVTSYYYDAFGNITEQSGTVNNSITYAGYQYDKETGLYYLNARMYDPKIARFMQEDTYRGKANDPLSLNLYTYCHNNPITYSDPTGHWAQNDKNLKQDARVAISRLTDLYYSTKDPAVKKQCADEANLIRTNTANKAITPQNSAVGAAFDAAFKKDGNVSAADWIKISSASYGTYTGTVTQNALKAIDSAEKTPSKEV